MPKKSKITGKTRLDKFYHLAKEQGFRSRAAFKLVQLNRKYDFLSSARALIDLCAAPGGWLQVAAKYMPVSSLIIGVDLDPIKPIPNVQTFQQDITTAVCRSQLRSALQHWKADVVLNDGSPNVGGAWTKDAYGQAELSLAALKLAVEFLRPGGIFVTKVFRSQDSNSLLWVCRQLFSRVDVTKPSASRGTSAEIYFVCHGFKAPEKADPRLFDPEHVFKNLDQGHATNNVLRDAPHKQKRQRSGYEDGVMILHKSLPLIQFLDAENPAEILADYNAITFKSEEELRYKSHSASTDDIIAACADLKVLGRKDFKALIQWRRALKKFREQLSKDSALASSESESECDQEEDEETRIAKENEELEEFKKSQLAKAKREKRKRKEQKMKARQRQLGMVEIEGDEGQAGALFTLGSIKSQSDLTTVDAGEIHEGDSDDDLEIFSDAGSQSDSNDFSSDEDHQADDNVELEQQLEELYKLYKAKRGHADRGKPAVGLLEDEYKENLAAEQSSDDESDEDLSVGKNPLQEDLAHLTKETKQSVQAERWFSRDIFEGLTDIPTPSCDFKVQQSQSEDESCTNDVLKEAFKLAEKFKGGDSETVSHKGTISRSKPSNASSAAVASGDFEVVPVQESDDDDMSSDCEAEILAIGKQMLRKRRRQEIEDASYNRYAWQDSQDLPSWFVDDQKQHNRPILPLKKSDIDEMKARLAAINARPIKKIAEARARKKMAAVKKWEKVKAQAENIASSEMPDKEKFKKLGSLYESNSKMKRKKTEKQYVVNGKGTGAKLEKRKKGARLKMVDSRMKADSRGRKASDRKAKKAKKSLNKKKSGHKKK